MIAACSESGRRQNAAYARSRRATAASISPCHIIAVPRPLSASGVSSSAIAASNAARAAGQSPATSAA